MAGVTGRPLRVGIAGLGNVGVGVLQVLGRNGGLIAARAGRPIEIVAVSARDRGRDRGVDLSELRWVEDARSLAGDPEIDVVVELIGGADGVAYELVDAALRADQSVVTANKALLAHHGVALGRLADANAVSLGFEAAVAGGIPIIKTLREGLAANRVSRISGILNGTCNYVLSTMRESGRDFADVLAEAQALGYAEADPSLDVDGYDAAHKLAILASVAFGIPVDFASVYVEGIRHVSHLDVEYAQELGYRIKLLGTALLTERGIEQRVHPTLVPVTAPIAQVEGVFNAVVVEGDFVGQVMLQGRGAGAGPTASAVVADLIDIAAGRRLPAFVPSDSSGLTTVPIAEHSGASYVRLMVSDQPGVIADITAELRTEKVSVEAMIQRRPSPGSPVPLVFTTHPSQEAALNRALERIGALGTMLEPPTMFRIEG